MNRFQAARLTGTLLLLLVLLIVAGCKTDSQKATDANATTAPSTVSFWPWRPWSIPGRK